MSSINEIFKRLGGTEATKDYGAFREWVHTFPHAPEGNQLEWILNSQKISDNTKQLLVQAVEKENSAVEQEKASLLRFGYGTEAYSERVDKTAGEFHENHTRICRIYFWAAIVLVMVGALFCTYTKAEVFVRVLGCCFFTFGVIFLWEAREYQTRIKKSREEAAERQDQTIGRRVQERVEMLEKEEKELYELSKVILQKSVKNTE